MPLIPVADCSAGFAQGCPRAKSGAFSNNSTSLRGKSGQSGEILEQLRGCPEQPEWNSGRSMCTPERVSLTSDNWDGLRRNCPKVCSDCEGFRDIRPGFAGNRGGFPNNCAEARDNRDAHSDKCIEYTRTGTDVGTIGRGPRAIVPTAGATGMDIGAIEKGPRTFVPGSGAIAPRGVQIGMEARPYGVDTPSIRFRLLQAEYRPLQNALLSTLVSGGIGPVGLTSAGV